MPLQGKVRISPYLLDFLKLCLKYLEILEQEDQGCESGQQDGREGAHQQSRSARDISKR